WNGLMIGALAHAGRHLEEPKYIAAAEAAAKFILEHVRHPDGALRRTWRAGKSKGDGYLTDYAFLAHGLLDLHEATGKKEYLDEAVKLTEQMVRLFHDPKEGGFFFTGEDHDKLLVRAKDLGGGGNIPDGNGMAAQVLLRLGTLTREQKHVALAAGTLQSFASAMVSQPHGNESLVVGLAQLYETAEKWPEVAAAIAPRPASGADAATRTEPVTVEAFLERKQVRPGDTLKVAIRLAIDKGWHVYSHEPGTDVAIPTGVSLPKVNGLGIGAVRYPKATVSTDPVLKQKINTYEGTATLVVPLTVTKDASGVLRFELQVRTQACDDRRCLQPQTHTLALDVAVGETAGEARHTEIFKAAGAGRG
ncbi:MAG: protein-disulfide reductase DsbD family protein, partial [Phycisphaerae bacterium]|nr:protein-disulfide reductase DsbD family protein [Phycisphaerae bacterium]